MDNKIGIVFTSRNNYELLDNWCNQTDTSGFDILNIDEDSTDVQKTLGRSVCEKYGITKSNFIQQFLLKSYIRIYRVRVKPKLGLYVKTLLQLLECREK